MKYAFVLFVLFITISPIKETYGQTIPLPPIAKEVGGLTADRLLNIISAEEFCQKARPLWQEVKKQGLDKKPWRKPILFLMDREGCPPYIET